MAEDNDIGGCRHCGHTPVHASARWCPHCGGIAPYTRTPPPRSKNATVAIISLVVILAAVMVGMWFGGR